MEGSVWTYFSAMATEKRKRPSYGFTACGCAKNLSWEFIHSKESTYFTDPCTPSCIDCLIYDTLIYESLVQCVRGTLLLGRGMGLDMRNVTL